jgi:hypothetical protein
MDLKEIGREGVEGVRLAQRRDQWRFPVYRILNIWFHEGVGV